ncbi:alkaline phosphatase, partial [candidate division KSB1 bacterium]|nr:alkaline phosphatase [candidate division KSB1 bacterium]
MIEEEIDFNHAVAAVVRWVETHSSWEESLVIVTADHETGYLTGVNSGTSAAGQPIWNPLQNHGKGVLPGMEWHSGEHTNALIPFFAKGAASESLRQYADEIDPVRGHYLDNTEIAKFLFTLVNDPPRR